MSDTKGNAFAFFTLRPRLFLCSYPDSLNWFRCLQAKFSSDEDELDAKRTTLRRKSDAKVAAAKKQSWFSNTGDDDSADEGYSEEMSVLEMIEKKLQANRREMAMLFFSMNGAQSLFP